MFALGSLEVRPTIVERVNPKINGIYVIFMTLPFFVLLGVLAVSIIAKRRYGLTIPHNSWELLMFGREEKEIPKRADPSEFPEPDKMLVLALQEGKSSKLSVVSLSGADIEVSNTCLGEEEDQKPPVVESVEEVDEKKPQGDPSGMYLVAI